MIKSAMLNTKYLFIPNTNNRPYLLNEKTNTNIKDSIKKQENIEQKLDGKDWARTILSNESAHNKIAVMWAKGILKND